MISFIMYLLKGNKMHLSPKYQAKIKKCHLENLKMKVNKKLIKRLVYQDGNIGIQNSQRIESLF